MKYDKLKQLIFETDGNIEKVPKEKCSDCGKKGHIVHITQKGDEQGYHECNNCGNKEV